MLSVSKSNCGRWVNVWDSLFILVPEALVAKISSSTPTSSSLVHFGDLLLLSVMWSSSRSIRTNNMFWYFGNMSSTHDYVQNFYPIDVLLILHLLSLILSTNKLPTHLQFCPLLWTRRVHESRDRIISEWIIAFLPLFALGHCESGQ